MGDHKAFHTYKYFTEMLQKQHKHSKTETNCTNPNRFPPPKGHSHGQSTETETMNTRIVQMCKSITVHVYLTIFVYDGHKDGSLVNAQPSQHNRKLNLQLQVTITTDLKLERFSELYLLISRFNHTTGILLYSFSHMIT